MQKVEGQEVLCESFGHESRRQHGMQWVGNPKGTGDMAHADQPDLSQFAIDSRYKTPAQSSEPAFAAESGATTLARGRARLAPAAISWLAHDR